MSQLQHIPRGLKRSGSMCHSERVNWVPPFSSAGLGCRCALSHIAAFVIELLPSRHPPQLPLRQHLFFLLLRSPYSRAPYLACVYNLTECWISGSPFTVTLTHTWCPSNTVRTGGPPSRLGPRRTDRA